MALTKTATVLRNDVSLAAGAGPNTSADNDVSGSYRTLVRVRFTNGGSGPTVPAKCQIQVSEDTTGANYMILVTVDGGTVNNAVSEYVIEVPDASTHVRIVDGFNTGQPVIIRAVLEKVTGI